PLAGLRDLVDEALRGSAGARARRRAPRPVPAVGPPVLPVRSLVELLGPAPELQDRPVHRGEDRALLVALVLPDRDVLLDRARPLRPRLRPEDALEERVPEPLQREHRPDLDVLLVERR